MDDVTEATSRSAFTLDSVEALLPVERRRWSWREGGREGGRGARAGGGEKIYSGVSFF